MTDNRMSQANNERLDRLRQATTILNLSGIAILGMGCINFWLEIDGISFAMVAFTLASVVFIASMVCSRKHRRIMEVNE